MSARQAQKERAAEDKKKTKKKSEALVNAGKMCRAKALQQLNAAEGIAGDHVSDVNSIPSSASAMDNSTSPLNGKSKYLQKALSGIFDNFMDRIEERTVIERQRMEQERARDREARESLMVRQMQAHMTTEMMKTTLNTLLTSKADPVIASKQVLSLWAAPAPFKAPAPPAPAPAPSAPLT